MSTSSSIRISLRRKRSTRSGENSGSPVIKKSSPKLPEAQKEPPSTPKTHTSRHLNKVSRSATRTSPRLSRGRSTDKSDNEENLQTHTSIKYYNEDKHIQTPASGKWSNASEDSLRQPSPDMPFLSSQLCGTQECEVVWDCDSPGFSRDELKRMHKGGEMEGPERTTPIAPAPPRQLFPQTRTRLARASASGNTTAQLNDLLDLLSSKENAGRNKVEAKEDPHILQNTFQHLVPPKDIHSEDSSSSESLELPRPLRETSSQPFEVVGVSDPKDNNQASLSSDGDESVWGDDLNLGLCDISNTVLEECAGNTKVIPSVQKSQTDRSHLSSENAELSSVSADIFDDDLFSESVILSTQAVEDAMIGKKNKDISSDRSDSNADFSKRVQQELKNVNLKDEGNHRNIKSVENDDKNTCKSELSTCTMLTTNISTNGRILSEVNIRQNNSPPRRQVRRSFRFRPSPADTAKSGGPSTETRMTRNSLNSICGKQSPDKTSKESWELKKTDMITTFGTEKTNIQNMSSNLTSNKLSNALSLSYNQSAQVTQLPSTRRPLFRNNQSKLDQMRHRGNTQGNRGTLVRSQSIGNTRLTTTSPMTRRSNSSMEMDTSEDLDDDEFFKSLLSMLPEEEGNVCGNPASPLSPITTDNASSRVSHASGKKSDNSILVTGKNSEVREKSNNNKTDSRNSLIHKNVQSNHSVHHQNVHNGSVRTALMSQGNRHPGVANPKVNAGGKKQATNVQGVVSGPNKEHHDTIGTRGGGGAEVQTSDTFDDGLFEDDVLSLIDEVESQFGSQNAPCEPSSSPLSSQPQQMKCTQDEIARKKAAALQRREERKRQQCM